MPNLLRLPKLINGLLMTLALAAITTGASAQEVAQPLYRIPLYLSGPESGLSIQPSPVDFGEVAISTSETRTVVVRNDSSAPVSGLAATASEAFFVTPAQGCASLAPGASCSMQVSYFATQNGPSQGTLSVAYTSGVQASARLQATKLRLAEELELSEENWNFGPWLLGTASPSKSLVMRNVGAYPYAIESIKVGENAEFYHLSHNCGSSLAVGASCVISVYYQPTAEGLHLSRFRIRGADDSLRDVNMRGIGSLVAVDGPVLSVATVVNAGEVPMNSKGSPKALVFRNSGNQPLELNSVASTGSDFLAFELGADCSGTLQPGATCSLPISFAPKRLGAHHAALELSSNDAFGPTFVTLYGDGTPPLVDAVIEATESNLDFGGTYLHEPVERTFVLKNQGPDTVEIAGLYASDSKAFAVTHGCFEPLAVGETCTVRVRYMAAGYGEHAAQLTLASNSTSTLHVPMRGLTYHPLVVATPATWHLPDTGLGVASAPMSFQLTNGGDGELKIKSMGLVPADDASGAVEFEASNTCADPLPPGAACEVRVVFQPAKTGSRSASLAVFSNADPDVPTLVSLVGEGLHGALAFTPAALDFGQVLQGDSASLSSTVVNKGPGVVSLAGVTLPKGAFEQVNTCGGVLPVDGECQVTVTVSPTTDGPLSATLDLVMVDGARASLPLTAAGAIKGALEFVPASLDLGEVEAGQTLTKEFRVRNPGVSPVELSSLGLRGGHAEAFTVTSSCPAVLEPDSDCPFQVSGTPPVMGSVSSSVVALGRSDVVAASAAVTVTGFGTAKAVLEPEGLVFDPQDVMVESPEMVAQLQNTGGFPLSIRALRVSGDFSLRHECPAVLQAGTACSVFVKFRPTAEGLRTGQLTLESDQRGAPTQDFTLSGEGLVGVLTANPSPVAFALDGANQQTLTVSNVGRGSLVVNRMAIEGAPDMTGSFQVNGSCAGRLQPGGSCSLSVTFSPLQGGENEAELVLTPSYGETLRVPLTGTAAPRSLLVAPLALAFEDTEVRFSSSTRNVLVTNDGKGPVRISGIVSSEPGAFGVSDNCPASLPEGGACAVSAMFTPDRAGLREGFIEVRANVPEGAVQVAVQGAGLETTVEMSPTLVDFGEVLVGRTAQRVAQLRNTGEYRMKVDSVGVTGTGFTQTNQCGKELLPGTSCDIFVTYSPRAIDLASGALRAETSAGSAQVALAGAGIGLKLISVSPAQVNAAGGDAITLGGSGFSPSTVVLVDGQPLESVTMLSPGVLTAVTRAHAPGMANVTVAETDFPSSTLPNALEFLAPPSVLSVNPSEGSTAGGWVATVTGEQLTCSASYVVGGRPATPSNCSQDRTRVDIAVPASTTGLPGVVDLAVTTAVGTSVLKEAIRYVLPPATFTFSADSGAVGEVVRNVPMDHTVTVTNSGGAAGFIKSAALSGSPAMTVVSGGSCGSYQEVALPAGKSCTFKVRVLSSDVGSSTAAFLVNSGHPEFGQASLQLTASVVVADFAFSGSANGVMTAPDGTFTVLAEAIAGLPTATTASKTFYFHNLVKSASSRLVNAEVSITGAQASFFRLARVQAAQGSTTTCSAYPSAAIAGNQLSASPLTVEAGNLLCTGIRVDVVYAPPAGTTAANATLNIRYNDGSLASMPIFGDSSYTATAFLSDDAAVVRTPAADVGPVGMNTPPAAPATKTVRYFVHNRSPVPSPLKIYRMYFEGPDADAFEITSWAGKGAGEPVSNDVQPQNATVAGGEGDTPFELAVRMQPNKRGAHQATMVIEHSSVLVGAISQSIRFEGANDLSVSLSNAVSQQDLDPRMSSTPVAIRSGGVQRYVYLRNAGTVGQLVVTGFQIVGDPAFTMRAAFRAGASLEQVRTFDGTDIRSSTMELVADDVGSPDGRPHAALLVDYNPQEAGVGQRAVFTVFHNGPGGQTTFELSGDAVSDSAAHFSLTSNGVKATSVTSTRLTTPGAVASQTVYLVNKSQGSGVYLEDLVLNGADEDQFTITNVSSVTAQGAVVQVLYSSQQHAQVVALKRLLSDGQGLRITYEYRPTRDGAHVVQLSATGDMAEPAELALNGSLSTFAGFVAGGLASQIKPTISADGRTANYSGGSGLPGFAAVGSAALPAGGKYFAEFTPWNANALVGALFVQSNGVTLDGPLLNLNTGAMVVSGTKFTGPKNGTTVTSKHAIGDSVALAMDLASRTLQLYHYRTATQQCSLVATYTVTDATLGWRPMVRFVQYQTNYVTLPDGLSPGQFKCPIPAGYQLVRK